jgi:hypothetical protein
MTERYEQLLALTRRQRDLVDDGLWQEAVAAGQAWQELVSTLPEQAPPEARPLLEEAASIAWSCTAAIEALVAGLSRELEHVGRGRRALASYAAGAIDPSNDANG